MNTESPTTRPPFYPLFRDLAGRRCVVVGGGKVAARKATDLVRCGAEVHVVSPAFDAAFDRALGYQQIAEPYVEKHLEGAVIVIAATDDPQVNRQVAEDARQLGAWVNVVDRPELCDFHVPAVVRRGPIQIAVSTGGASPALARGIRETLENAVDEACGQLAELLGRLRPRILAEVADPEVRRQLLEELASEAWLDRLRTDGIEATRDAMIARVASREH